MYDKARKKRLENQKQRLATHEDQCQCPMCVMRKVREKQNVENPQ